MNEESLKKLNLNENDYKYFLYLLSIITNIPEEYKEYIKDLKLEDIMIDESFKDANKRNQIRKDAFQRRFHYTKNFSKILTHDTEKSITDIIEAVLLDKATKVEKNRKITLINLINNNNFHQLEQLLIVKNKNQGLSVAEAYTLKLVKILINIRENKELPTIGTSLANDTLTAIDDGDYFRALELSAKYNKDANISNKVNSMYLLLVKICDYIKKYSNIKVKNDPCEELVFKFHDQLIESKGIKLLDFYDENKTKIILNIAKQYDDMDAFLIKYNDVNRIVLRYVKKDKDVNVSTLINEAKLAYDSKDYSKSININLKLLQMYDKPNSGNYCKIGLTYLHLGKKKKALEYFIVASSIARENGLNDFDYDDIIAVLTSKENEEIKPKVRMEEESFYDDYYGIDNFDEINDFVNLTQSPVDESCENNGILGEDMFFVQLIYAREYYKLGQISMGDSFLNFVKNSKNKTPKLISAIKEIEANKKYYKNREDKRSDISLKLRPTD